MKAPAIFFPKWRHALLGALFSLVMGLSLAVLLNDLAWGLLLGSGLGLADFLIFLRDKD
jgi:hypothetical protein